MMRIYINIEKVEDVGSKKFGDNGCLYISINEIRSLLLCSD